MFHVRRLCLHHACKPPVAKEQTAMLQNGALCKQTELTATTRASTITDILNIRLLSTHKCKGPPRRPCRATCLAAHPRHVPAPQCTKISVHRGGIQTTASEFVRMAIVAGPPCTFPCAWWPGASTGRRRKAAFAPSAWNGLSEATESYK